MEITPPWRWRGPARERDQAFLPPPEYLSARPARLRAYRGTSGSVLAAFLAEIEPDYANSLDPIERKYRLVLAVRNKWPSLTAHEVAAFVQLFLAR